jgi:hypothetical protein
VLAIYPLVVLALAALVTAPSQQMMIGRWPRLHWLARLPLLACGGIAQLG